MLNKLLLAVLSTLCFATMVSASTNSIENKTDLQLKIVITYTKVGFTTPDKCETVVSSLAPRQTIEFSAVTSNCMVRTIDVRASEGKRSSITLSTPATESMKVTIYMDNIGKLQILCS